MVLAPDIMVTDKVRLVRRLGEGAMGEVWVGLHETLKAEVAVKFLAEDIIIQHPDSAERFSVEAAAAARIRSPHVVRTFDHGTMPDGTPYIVMELLDGESLQARLDKGGPLSVTETYEVVRQIGKALDSAHAAGIVHRDVKPHNIFLMNHEGELFVKLLDFGSAKLTAEERRVRLTLPGMLIGTPEYISRDLITDPKALSHLADLWALGVVAYKCLTGEVPFQGDDIAAICQSIVEGRFRRPSRTRRDLTRVQDEWFSRVFSHDPADRPGSGGDMAKSFLESAQIERRSRRRSGRLRERLSIAALALSVLLAGAAVFITQRARAPEGTTTATSSPPSAVAPEPTAAASAEAVARGTGGSGGSPAAGGGAAVSLGDGDMLVMPAASAPELIAPEPLVDALARARVSVPGGAFWMGCAADRDPDCNDDEKPGRLIAVDEFAIDRVEVSVTLYFRCTRGGACSTDKLGGYELDGGPFVASDKCNWGHPERRHHPINCVTWAQADAFCRWAGARLPSEAEWEKAARGVDKRRFPWSGEHANCELAVMGEGAQGCRAGGTWPVGTKRAGASPYGVLNMAGNVREWVADWYDAGYYKKAAGKNPTGPDTGKLRVGRGGSWGNAVARFLRTSVREGLAPETRSIHLGFRCAGAKR